MNDMRYVLSIKELIEHPSAEQMIEQAYMKLDEQRKQKLAGMKHKRKYAESLGAGLLLQLGLQKFYDENGNVKKEICNSKKVGLEIGKPESGIPKRDGLANNENCEIGASLPSQNKIQYITVSDILTQLKEPIEVTYCYGKHGKPYFKNIPIHFNLSHSEDYVCCVFSEQEVGVDIQYQKPLTRDSIIRRFFTENEQRIWDSCSSKEEQENCFFRLWVRKESYGKLTGEGIAVAASVDVSDNSSLGVYWEDYEILKDYRISICKRTKSTFKKSGY